MMVSSLNQSLCIAILFVGLIVSLAPISCVYGTNESPQSNKLLFPKSMFPQSDMYKSGWSAGFLGQPFKGQHERDYIFGYLNGTTTYVYNYNETSGHTMDWYIGFHNGAAVADDQYQKGGNFDYPGCHDGKNYCDGFSRGYDVDSNAFG
jgi:hypothetical protein